MKKIIVIFLFFFLLFSCNIIDPGKEGSDKDSGFQKRKTTKLRQKEPFQPLLLGNWVLKGISHKSADSMVIIKDQYMLQILSENSFKLKLDVNDCGGKFRISGGKMDFLDMYCTEACCDSELALQILSALTHADAFSLQEDVLTFIGETGLMLHREKNVLTGTWKLEQMEMPDGEIKYIQGSYVMTIPDWESYQVKLDINNCFGKILVSANQIAFDSPACTKACCDSDFANTLLHVLSEVKAFSFQENRLILHGKRVLAFKKI
jgi:heat shock protein HslJ